MIFGRKEGFKDPLTKWLWNPRAIVDDLDQNLLILHSRTDGHLPTTRDEQRIVAVLHQIDQDLLQLTTVATNAQQ